MNSVEAGPPRGLFGLGLVLATLTLTLALTLTCACSGDREASEDGPRDCGVPRLATCTTTLSSAECQARGGLWLTPDVHPIAMCLCPTGDYGCACTDARQCQGTCMAENIANAEACLDATRGVCSLYTTPQSCFCELGDRTNPELPPGEPRFICVN
ncbi:MAG: hypothetical protein IT384_16165 [Deltaproteobacteria bacterium]|nr:hypothetical protein [Deltaproteobacteria bacterium]